ncbi:MAG TPA: hypothetical protein VNX15_06060, partial [Gemmatimonadales bacterium]|nr:hypothetical protein [Gemmatimonadales bacterium]
MRLASLLLLGIVAPAAAQQLPREPPRYAATFPGRSNRQGPPLVTPGDHAWEGAKVGGLILGLGGLGVGYAWCAQGDTGHPTNFGYCAPRSLIGGLIGATIGAVMGGFIGS